MSEDTKRKDRPGDQPPPVPNDGPSMHAGLRGPGCRPCCALDIVALEDFEDRKQLGIARYGSRLKAHNGRDWQGPERRAAGFGGLCHPDLQ